MTFYNGTNEMTGTPGSLTPVYQLLLKAPGGSNNLMDIGDYWLTLVLLILFGLIFLIFTLHTRRLLEQKVNVVNQALDVLERNDPIWRKKHLMQTVETRCTEIQYARSTMNRTILKKLLTDELFTAWGKQFDRMVQSGQVYVIDPIRIDQVLLVDIKDFTDDDLDRFTARIKGSSVRYTKNGETGKWEEPRWDEHVFSNQEMEPEDFIEFWTFQRQRNIWLLEKIETEWREGDYTESHPVLADEKYQDSSSSINDKKKNDSGSDNPDEQYQGSGRNIPDEQ